MHSLVFFFSKACQMQNTFFLLFVLVRQQFYKIVSHIISIYFQEVISNSM